MSRRVVFTGGGTAGHVYPGLAVAAQLRTLGVTDIGWIGSTRGIERKICARAAIPFFPIPSGKLRRYVSHKNFFDLFRIAAGFFRALSILTRLKPDILFSKGGYVSVPPVIAARLLGIPCITHESDVIPGLATRINAHFVGRVLLPYETSARHLSGRSRRKSVVIGNPVRTEITGGDPERGKALVGASSDLPLLFVFGGSLGSATINSVIADLKEELSGICFTVHQRGNRPQLFPDDQAYVSRSFFYTEMPDLLAAADLVVARAGAGTLWELAATGTPAILVPLGTAGSRGDQIENARVYGASGAAVVVPDERATAQRIGALIVGLLSDKERRERMSRAARSFAARDVAMKIAKMILSSITKR